MFLLLTEVISNTQYYVGTVLPPVALALGGLGNLFCLLVFSFSHLRRLTSSPVLIGLSVCHSIALWCMFIVWLERLDIFLIENAGLCQILNFLHHSSSFLGVAFVFCFTLERYISFCWSKNASGSLRGHSRQRGYVVTTIVLSVIVPVFCVFLFVQLGENEEFKCKCCFTKLPNELLDSESIFVPRYLLSFYYIIAAILMLVTIGLDMCIMCTLFLKERERRSANARMNSNGGDHRSLRKDFDQVSVDNVSIGHCDDLNGTFNTWPKDKIESMPRPLRKMRRKQLGELKRSRSLLSIRSTINATRMLFAASIAFTVMQLPFCGHQVYESFLFFWGKNENYTPNQLFYNLAVVLYVLGLDVGFIIYMCFGSNFREAVKMLLTCQYGRAFAHAPCIKRRRARSMASANCSRRNSDDKQSMGSPIAEKKQPPSENEKRFDYMDDDTEKNPKAIDPPTPREIIVSPGRIEPGPVLIPPTQSRTPHQEPSSRPPIHGYNKAFKDYRYQPRIYSRPEGYGRPSYERY